MLPMFAFCDPAIARNLVMYRVRNLEGGERKRRNTDTAGHSTHGRARKTEKTDAPSIT